MPSGSRTAQPFVPPHPAVAALAMEIVADLLDPESGFSVGEAWVGEREGWLAPADATAIEQRAVDAFLRRTRAVA